jgi:hypothetical protein
MHARTHIQRYRRTHERTHRCPHAHAYIIQVRTPRGQGTDRPKYCQRHSWCSLPCIECAAIEAYNATDGSIRWETVSLNMLNVCVCVCVCKRFPPKHRLCCDQWISAPLAIKANKCLLTLSPSLRQTKFTSTSPRGWCEFQLR